MLSQPAVDPFDELKAELRDRLTVDGRVYLIPLGDLYVHAVADAARIRGTAIEEPIQTIRSGRKIENPLSRSWTGSLGARCSSGVGFTLEGNITSNPVDWAVIN